MTTTTAPIANRADDPSRVRLAVLCATVLACVPYIVLKVAWIAGSNVGTSDAAAADEMHRPATVIGNALTLGLELCAVGTVVALTFAWGRRMPPLLVLGPMWVGTGLLAPVALGLPLGLAVQTLAGGSPTPGDSGLHGWVFAAVYGGFVAQAILLVTAFTLHAASRWPWAFRERVHRVPAGSTYPLQTVLCGLGVVGTGLYAAAYLLWVAGGERFGGPTGFDTVAQHVFLAVSGILPLVGAGAVRTLVRRRRTGRLAGPLSLAWIGSGTAFVAFLLPSKDITGLESFVNAVGAVSGVGLAFAGLLVLVDAREPAAQS